MRNPFNSGPFASQSLFDYVTGSSRSLPFVIIDNGTGGASILVLDGGSIPIQLDGYPETTLMDVSGDFDIGLLYAPSLSTGDLIIGTTITFDLGVIYYQGSGSITVVQDLRRGGTTVASDIRASVAPSTYNHTVVVDDLTAPLTVRTTLTNGTNAVVVDTEVTTLSPILQAGATVWVDFSDTSTLSSGGLTGGAGDEIGLVTDKSSAANNLTQTSRLTAPRQRNAQVNGNTMLEFQNNDFLIVPDLTVRSAFFVTSGLTGSTNGVAPLIGSNYEITAGPHEHLFIRCDGLTDYDASLNGSVGNSGTIYADTGDSATGGDVTMTGLSVAEREGTRLWYVEMDADMENIDALGALQSGFNSLRNDGTLFGEVVLFPTTLTTAEANAVANDIATRWGLTWSDI